MAALKKKIKISSILFFEHTSSFFPLKVIRINKIAFVHDWVVKDQLLFGQCT